MAASTATTQNQGGQNGKRRRLGKGLSGLIGDPVRVATTNGDSPPAVPGDSGGAPAQGVTEAQGAPAAAVPDASDASKSDRVVHVPLGSIIPNRFQPRSDFDAAGLGELAASIRAEGVMQPVLVRPASGSGSTGGRYELIAGERRWRAAKLAGLDRVPAIVRELSDESSAEWALIENIHRQDLNAMERAEAMASLLSRFGMSQSALAEKLGLERPTVANLVRLMELEVEIRDLIASGQLGAGHGKALLSIASGERRVSTARAAAVGGWSVRRLEREAKRVGSGSSTPTKPLPASQRTAVIESLERRLGDHLGTKVAIRTNESGTKGRIEIRFFDREHFDGLLRSIGVEDIGT